MSDKQERLPLDGIRVLELGTLLAGPFSGRLFADFGAEVIKIEPPDKMDPMRNWGKSKEGTGLWWPIQSRNKKSITLNLREEEGTGIIKGNGEGSGYYHREFPTRDDGEVAFIL